MRPKDCGLNSNNIEGSFEGYETSRNFEGSNIVEQVITTQTIITLNSYTIRYPHTLSSDLSKHQVSAYRKMHKVKKITLTQVTKLSKGINITPKVKSYFLDKVEI